MCVLLEAGLAQCQLHQLLLENYISSLAGVGRRWSSSSSTCHLHTRAHMCKISADVSELLCVVCSRAFTAFTYARFMSVCVFLCTPSYVIDYSLCGSAVASAPSFIHSGWKSSFISKCVWSRTSLTDRSSTSRCYCLLCFQIYFICCFRGKEKTKTKRCR